MKKTICLLLIAALLLTGAACGKKNELSYDVYSSPESININSIINMTSPTIMMNRVGAFQMDIRNDDPFNAGANASTTSLRYAYDEDMNVEANQFVDYDNGGFTRMYFTSSDADPYLYYMDETGAQALNMTVEELQEALTYSVFGLEYYAPEITECGKTENGEYTATVDCYTNDEDHVLVCTINMDMDPVTGYVSRANTLYYTTEGENAGATTTTFTYSKSIEIDKTPKEEAPEREVPTESDTAAVKSGSFTFAAHDLDGNFVTYQDFADAKLIMVNFWEPWCVSCLDELPDLKVLYDDYKDQGFVILGVTCDTTALEDAKSIVQEYALDYPILQADAHLSSYATDYVPTTYFIDADGNLLTDEPYIGSMTYEEWTEIVSDFLSGSSEESDESAE